MYDQINMLGVKVSEYGLCVYTVFSQTFYSVPPLFPLRTFRSRYYGVSLYHGRRREGGVDGVSLYSVTCPVKDILQE